METRQTNGVFSIERFQLRSRPRPGGTQVKNPAIIAPPPIPCRRNSTTNNGANNCSAVTDLINFTSPIKQDNHLDEYCTAAPSPPP